MANTNEFTSAWHWSAVDYGKTAMHCIELAQTRGMWADIAFAYLFARKAAHFGIKELARRHEAVNEMARYEGTGHGQPLDQRLTDFRKATGDTQ